MDKFTLYKKIINGVEIKLTSENNGEFFNLMLNKAVDGASARIHLDPAKIREYGSANFIELINELDNIESWHDDEVDVNSLLSFFISDNEEVFDRIKYSRPKPKDTVFSNMHKLA